VPARFKRSSIYLNDHRLAISTRRTPKLSKSASRIPKHGTIEQQSPRTRLVQLKVLELKEKKKKPKHRTSAFPFPVFPVTSNWIRAATDALSLPPGHRCSIRCKLALNLATRGTRPRSLPRESAIAAVGTWRRSRCENYTLAANIAVARRTATVSCGSTEKAG